MIVETKKILKNGKNLRKITKIVSQSGEVQSFGYAFNKVSLKDGELIPEREFQNKIRIIRKCEKKVFTDGKVNLVPYRSDNEWYKKVNE